jgi:cell wall-associated NlpC family hydrolase
MLIRKLVPCMLWACPMIALSMPAVSAQTGSLRSRLVTNVTAPAGTNRLESDPVIVSLASTPIDDIEDSNSMAAGPAPRIPHFLRFDHLLSSAIDVRLGARYVWGAAGPGVFDCSGFVWSAFQSVGINFERGSARSLWSRFAPASPSEESRFGTLVFFNNLRHIGIVADAHGFYHASRRHGVVYSRFNDYWLARIDGFRRVPVPPSQQVSE